MDEDEAKVQLPSGRKTDARPEKKAGKVQ